MHVVRQHPGRGGANRERFFGSELAPVAPECPSTTIESGYPGVLTGAVVVEVVTRGLAEGAVLPLEEHAARARIDAARAGASLFIGTPWTSWPQ